MAARLRSQWDRDEGLGQNDNAVKFLGQDYESLRARCLQSQRLFEDNLFACAASSLGFDELGPRSSKTQGVRWMRPTVRGQGGVGGAQSFTKPVASTSRGAVLSNLTHIISNLKVESPVDPVDMHLRCPYFLMLNIVLNILYTNLQRQITLATQRCVRCDRRIWFAPVRVSGGEPHICPHHDTTEQSSSLGVLSTHTHHCAVCTSPEGPCCRPVEVQRDASRSLRARRGRAPPRDGRLLAPRSASI